MRRFLNRLYRFWRRLVAGCWGSHGYLIRVRTGSGYHLVCPDCDLSVQQILAGMVPRIEHAIDAPRKKVEPAKPRFVIGRFQ